LASLLTGTFPSAHGVTWNTVTNAFTGTTLAQILQDHGYRTVARIANPVAEAFSQGFEDFGMPPDIERGGPGMFGGASIVREVERLLDQPSDRPLFLWLHLMDPHGPYFPPPQYQALFVDSAYEWPGEGDLPVSGTDYGVGVLPRY